MPVIAPVRERLAALFEIVAPIPYTELQLMLDPSAPGGVRAYEKTLDVDSLSDDVIATRVSGERGRHPLRGRGCRPRDLTISGCAIRR